MTRRGPDGGVLWVALDQAPADDRQLPRDALGRFVVDLYAPREEWHSVVTLAGGLTDGPHTVTLTVGTRAATAPGGARAAIDAVVVDRRAGFPVVLPIAAAALAAVWAVAWKRPWRRARGRG